MVVRFGRGPVVSFIGGSSGTSVVSVSVGGVSGLVSVVAVSMSAGGLPDESSGESLGGPRGGSPGGPSEALSDWVEAEEASGSVPRADSFVRLSWAGSSRDAPPLGICVPSAEALSASATPIPVAALAETRERIASMTSR
jgi:hypothetical protein